jgi:hypothetical protein
METERRKATLVEIEQVVAESKSGSHGGRPFLEGLHYGLMLAGLIDDPEIQQSWARGETRAAQRSQIHE